MYEKHPRLDERFALSVVSVEAPESEAPGGQEPVNFSRRSFSGKPGSRSPGNTALQAPQAHW
jgi:hypothetical protein